ncbi:MAG: transposase [Trichodesmium sp. St19_bin1]|nr:transposase [Trichodesmium sp. St19_bin1]
MGRKKYIESEQDKLDRMQRVTEAIAEIESYLQFFEDKGQQADSGCWVVRYQVRQKDKIYWYYKLQADRPIFKQKTGESFSKYQHLGKAGTSDHVDAVMAVLRRTIVSELQTTRDSLKSCLIDIAYDEEHKSR